MSDDEKPDRPSTREVVEWAIDATKADKKSTWEHLAGRVRNRRVRAAEQGDAP